MPPRTTTAGPARSIPGRIIRASASLSGLLAMLAGLPAALIATAGWPLPDTWPTGQQWLTWLDRPVTVPFLVGLFACAGWLLWAGLLLAVVAEILSMLTRLDTSRWRLPAPLRALAAGLVGAVVIAITGTAARATAPTQAPAPVAVAPGPSTAAGVSGAGRASAPPASSATTTKVHHGTITFTVSGERYHAIVRRGDTMSKIARQWLGDADRWPEICRLNWHRHWPKTGGKLRDCDIIYPRWDLRLPADATPPPGAVRLGAPAKPPQQPAPPQVPPPTATPPADPDGVVEPTTNASAPTADDRDDQRSDITRDHDDVGVTLADGWVGTALAAAILAAVAAAWALRLHRYPPRTPSGPRNPDPWWPPTSDIVRRLLASRRHDVEPDDEDFDDAPAVVTGPVWHAPTFAARHLPPGATVEALGRQLDHEGRLSEPEPAATTAPAGTVTYQATTATGPELSGIGPLPATGLFLTGPGAPAAARALITATLATHGRQHGQIVTDRTTANALFDQADLRHHGLTVADTTADALGHLTRQILARARQTQEHDQPTPAPTTILLLDSAAGHHKVIDALLPVGAANNIGAVLLTPHRPADGDTITVDTDGHSDLGRRLAVLDATSALDLLELLNPEPDPVQQPNPPVTFAEPEPAAYEPASETTKIQVRILGRPRILDRHGKPITGLRTAAIQTLVLLAVRRTHIAKIDLWEALFPEATMQRAEERFAVTIADLRNGFRRAGGDRSVNAVPNLGGRYHLDPNLVEVDLWRFDDYLATAGRITDLEVRRDHLRRAVALHAGPLADGTDYDWTEPVQHAHTSRVIDALVALAESAHDPSEAAELLDQACELAPGNTAVFQLALRAFGQAQDLDRTRVAVDRYLAVLNELDVGLDTATERLIEVARSLVSPGSAAAGHA